MLTDPGLSLRTQLPYVDGFHQSPASISPIGSPIAESLGVLAGRLSVIDTGRLQPGLHQTTGEALSPRCGDRQAG